MDTIGIPDRYPNGCEIVVPLILTVPLYIEPVVVETASVCADQAQATVDSESKPIRSKPEPILPQATPVKLIDRVSTIFKSAFNKFATLILVKRGDYSPQHGDLGNLRLPPFSH